MNKQSTQLEEYPLKAKPKGYSLDVGVIFTRAAALYLFKEK
ncbi:hypothetical protein [uncultured Anaerococcus sp.]|nr:hypothetical protein [uncultured Anaerococcus sp.]